MILIRMYHNNTIVFLLIIKFLEFPVTPWIDKREAIGVSE